MPLRFDRTLLLAILIGGSTARAVSLPLLFEPNLGQVDVGTLFVGRGPGYHIEFDRSGISLSSDRKTVRMKLQGASPTARISGYGPQEARANYFVGSRERWIRDVPLYRGVRFEELYPGISLVFYSTGSELEYDFSVAPGAAPSIIKLSFEGISGMRLDDGDLVLMTTAGELRHRRPRVYQPKDGGRSEVAGRFVIRGPAEAGFEMDPYDPEAPLVIDPVMTYATYLGGAGNDSAWAVAADSAGCVYVAGETWAVNFPRTFKISNATGNQDAFLIKLNASGTGILYATYFGGQGRDSARGVAVDTAGNAYITGFTYSSDFPTLSGSYRSSSLGMGDVFVMKLNASGSALIYSALLGGSGSDFATGIAIDAIGNAYVSGYTSSVNFATTAGVLQTAFGWGIQDGFAAKLNATGSQLVYSTYLGGTGNDVANAIAVDAFGSAYLAGYTDSPDFPTRNAVFPSPQGQGDAFIAKLNATATALVFSTYLGGRLADTATGIALDTGGNVYVTGSTLSIDFPVTAGAFQTANRGSYDTFVSALNPQGAALIYSTYIGGEGADQSSSIAVDATGVAYIAGYTYSARFPLQSPLVSAPRGGQEAFAAAVAPTGSYLLWSTYLGGAGDDQATGIALDKAGSVYVAGSTFSCDFPTTYGAYRTVCAGGDGFLVKLGAPAPSGPQTVSVAPSSGSGARQTFSYTVSSANGASNIASMYTLFNTAISGVSACHLYYNPPANLISLIDDAGGLSLPPAELGIVGSRSNSQCTLDTGASSAIAAGNSLTLNLALSFGSNWVGTKNNYLWVSDRAGQMSGWTQMGTWTLSAAAPQSPVPVAVTPSSGTGASQTFSYTVSSATGAGNIAGIYTLLNTTISGMSACHLYYNPAANLISLIDDAGGLSLPPAVLGTAGSRSNSQCTLDTGASSANAAGNSLTLNLALSFGSNWAGTKNNYLWVCDRAGQTSGWTQRGTWTLSAAPQPPVAVAVTPSSGSGARQTFSYTVSSATSASNIAGMYTLLNTAVSGVGACHLFYNPAANLIYLIDDMGGLSLPSAVLGTAGSRSNSQCTLDTGASSVNTAGNSLTLNLTLSFSPNWAGGKNNYLWVSDRAGQTSGWRQMGAWTP